MSCSVVNRPTSTTAMPCRWVQSSSSAYPIQVLNASGTQVGHIPRNVAKELAPLMDTNLITVEGRMIGQNTDGRHHYKLAM